MKSYFFLRSAALAFLFLALCVASCKKYNDDETNNYFTAAELAELLTHTCLTEDADDGYAITDAPETGANDRAAGAKNKFWEPGKILRVRFLNGSPYLQNKVFAYAEQWEGYANVNFVKVTSGTSEIRILFSADGNFSSIGKDNGLMIKG